MAEICVLFGECGKGTMAGGGKISLLSCSVKQ